ncbi:MAG: glycosyltransferase [Acidobacteriota bacterium]|nr:MAG: glycosyltransferase [Acidobacteriota bacterium]
MILYLFYFFALIQLFFSWKSLENGLEYLRFFRSELGKPVSDPELYASVIVPCRDRDRGLRENLRAVMRQNHPAYEVVFVTDSAEDPACAVIREVITEHPAVPSDLVVAGRSIATGQKVRNLIEASKRISGRSEALVFVDSDARPSPGWLEALLDGLRGAERGCSTGYRWFIPEKGGSASHLRSVWNASIASALGPDTSRNFSWGGSTAILRSTFEELCVADNWEGKLADDFALTRMIRQAGGEVRFVPSCLTASVEDCTFRELLEFTTRQMKITRVYRPDLLAYSLIGSALYCGTMIAAIALLFFSSGVHFLFIALFLVLVLAAGTVKAVIRLNAVSLALPGYSEEIRLQYKWHAVLWAFTPLLFLWNDIAALFSRRIVWRGIEYELESAESTRVIGKGRSAGIS